MVGNPRRKRDCQMHPRFRSQDAERTAKCAVQRFHEDASSLGVKEPCLADVSSIVALVHEIGKDGLIKQRRAYISRASNTRKPVHQIRRNNHITESQGWKQSLAESADVDYARVLIQALEGSYRHALIAVFAVVVVLDDPRVGLLGPLEK